MRPMRCFHLWMVATSPADAGALGSQIPILLVQEPPPHHHRQHSSLHTVMGRSSALVGAKKSASERKDTRSARVMYFPCSRCFRFVTGATLYDLNSNSIIGAGISQSWGRGLMRTLAGSASRLPHGCRLSAGHAIPTSEGS